MDIRAFVFHFKWVQIHHKLYGTAQNIIIIYFF